MKLIDLKNMIKDLPDDTQIVVPASDHGYRKNIGVYVRDAENYKGRYLSEYYGPEYMTDPESPVVKVLVLSNV